MALFSRLTMDRGEGAFLYDVDGNRYIDLLAGVGVASLGYAHPKYVAAMQRQVARIHVGSFTSEHRAALVKLIAELTPGDLNRTQLYSSGAEAVEAAVRLAKSYTGKTEIVGFWGGFHGKTGGVLPLLGGSFKHGLGPLMPGTYSSPYASCARCAFDKTFPSCEWHCVDFLRRKIELETTNDVAAIIVEPIQGTAGNIVPPPGYLKALRTLADEIGALLIADEMITGFGRTGKMFGVEHDGIVPDIMTVGQGVRRRLPDERRDRAREGRVRQAVGQSERQLVELRRQPARGLRRAHHDRDHPRGEPRRPQPRPGREDAGRDEALGGRDPDRERRARARPDDRHRPGRAGHAHAARQEDHPLDLRHAARARRARDDLQPRGAHQSAARDRRGRGDAGAGHHEGRAA